MFISFNDDMDSTVIDECLDDIPVDSSLIIECSDDDDDVVFFF